MNESTSATQSSRKSKSSTRNTRTSSSNTLIVSLSMLYNYFITVILIEVITGRIFLRFKILVFSIFLNFKFVH